MLDEGGESVGGGALGSQVEGVVTQVIGLKEACVPLQLG